MIRARAILTERFRRTLVLAVAVMAAAVVLVQSFGPATPAAEAQALVISDLTVTSITSDSATITWKTLGVPSDTTVFYGLTQSPPWDETRSSATPTENHTLGIGPLNPGTTYWYAVRSSAGASVVESTPRQFPTPPASGDSIPPSLVNVRVDEYYRSADLTFSASEPVTWTIEWGQTAAYGNTVNCPAADCPAVNGTHEFGPGYTCPTDGNPGVCPNTLYHYQLRIVDASFNSFTSGDFTFRTTNSATDHTFSTGGCPTPGGGVVPIGACFGTEYCDGGTLRTDCRRCGASCAAGETCTAGGSCVADPPPSASAFQCNRDECYSGDVLIVPTPPGCWASWARCSANIVLKVKQDRVCDQWISCAATQEITNSQTGIKEEICVGVGGCSSIGPGGICNQSLGQGQCSNDPLQFCNTINDCPIGATCLTVTDSSRHFRPVTYATPSEVGKIRNLTGSIVAGLDWGGAATIIEGQYPWLLAPQWGETPDRIGINLRGDFEFPSLVYDQRNTSTDTAPFDQEGAATGSNGSPAFGVRLETSPNETGQDNLNHVLEFRPVPGSGHIYNRVWFTTFQNFDYFVTFRVKSEGGDTIMRPQLWFDPFTFVNLDATNTITVTGDWQEFAYGPVKGLNGQGRLNFFFPASAHPDVTVLFDDVEISSALEIRPSEYILPSCRLYPEENSPSCRYVSAMGARYEGQRGFCLERDSKDPAICIAWWPVDAIRGDENAFGIEQTAGFSGGQVYMCLQSRVYAQGPDSFVSGCADSGGLRCKDHRCKPRPNMCPPGYEVDPTFGHPDTRMRCRGLCERFGKDKCEWQCRAVGTPPVQEYNGLLTLLPGSTLQNRCAVIAKVSDYGQNAAWSKRTQYSSSYAVSPVTVPGSLAQPVPPSPLAQYPSRVEPQTSDTYALDYPFGRLTIPASSSDPASWETIIVRTSCQESTDDPLICLGKNPSQAAGSAVAAPAPYAWTYQRSNSNQRCLSAGADSNRDSACAANSACQPVQPTCTTASGAPTGLACASDTLCRYGLVHRACTYAAGATGTCDNSAATACRLNRVCADNFSRECTASPGSFTLECGVCAGDLATVCTIGQNCVDAGVAGPCVPRTCTIPEAQCNVGVTCENRGGIGQCSNDPLSLPTDGTGHGWCSDPNGAPISSSFCQSDADCGRAAEYCKEMSGQDAWSPTVGRCTNAVTGVETSRSCTTDSDCSRCLFPQRCIDALDCYESQCQPAVANTGICSSDRTTACTTSEECYNNAANDSICNDAQSVCVGGTNDGASCGNDVDCTVETCVSRGAAGENSTSANCRAIRGINAGPLNQAVKRLQRVFAEYYGLWYWSSGDNQYVKCDPLGVAGPCGNLTANPGDDYDIENNGGYGIFTNWHVPTARCSGARDETSEADYCGNPPQVFNAQWRGVTGSITIRRGESATLTFNTKVDGEQKPFRKIFIDWTGAADGSGIRSYEFPYDSKEKPANPHAFRNQYANFTTSPITYTPRILVQDNWGWCNNGVSGDPCLEPPSQWPVLQDSLGNTLTITVD